MAAPNTKLSITHSFFELQTPDFAWKFIWTVQPNDKVQKDKKEKIQKYKIEKYKNSKNEKMQKNVKMLKMQKVQKDIIGQKYLPECVF